MVYYMTSYNGVVYHMTEANEYLMDRKSPDLNDRMNKYFRINKTLNVKYIFGIF